MKPYILQLWETNTLRVLKDSIKMNLSKDLRVAKLAEAIRTGRSLDHSILDDFREPIVMQCLIEKLREDHQVRYSPIFVSYDIQSINAGVPAKLTDALYNFFLLQLKVVTAIHRNYVRLRSHNTRPKTRSK